MNRGSPEDDKRDLLRCKLDSYFVRRQRSEEEHVDADELIAYDWKLQLNPALTDFKELTNLICCRRNSVRADTGNKKKHVEGTKNLHLLLADVMPGSENNFPLVNNSQNSQSFLKVMDECIVADNSIGSGLP